MPGDVPQPFEREGVGEENRRDGNNETAEVGIHLLSQFSAQLSETKPKLGVNGSRLSIQLTVSTRPFTSLSEKVPSLLKWFSDSFPD